MRAGRANALRYPNAKLSRKKARVALAQLLAGCRAEQLETFTAKGLAASYNVALPTVEMMLAAAKMGRL